MKKIVFFLLVFLFVGSYIIKESLDTDFDEEEDKVGAEGEDTIRAPGKEDAVAPEEKDTVEKVEDAIRATGGGGDEDVEV